MIYQLGWTTLPGLRGLSCSDFRATPTDAPDTNRGVAMQFASEADRDEFLRRAEAEFGHRLQDVEGVDSVGHPADHVGGLT